MPYYKCPRFGTGTIDDPVRPALVNDLPTDGSMPWAATDLGDGTFLVFIDFAGLSAPDALTKDTQVIAVSDADALAIIQNHNPDSEAISLSVSNT